MLRIKENIKTIISVLVVGLSIIYFLSKGCSNEPSSESTTKIDTVFVPKIIKIPEIKGKFETVNPKPKDGVIIYDKELINKYNKLKTENDRLKEYEKAVKINNYENTYKYEKDDKVFIKVTNTTTGTLNNQKVEFNIPEREIEYKEKQIDQ